MDALLTSGWSRRGGVVCLCGGCCVEHTVCSPIPTTKYPPASKPLCVRVRVLVWQRNICAYAVVIVVKMAEGETEKEYDTRKAIEELRERFQGLTTALKESSQSPLEASLHFCQEFCQVLVEHAGRWKTDEDPLPLLEVYTVAILSFAKAASCLSSECENVPLLLEKLALSCAELLLLLPHHVPGALWEEFQSSMKLAHSLLQESGSTQLCLLAVLAQQDGVWSNTTLSSILSKQIPQTEQVHEYLELEGPTLLNMRIKHLIKVDSVDKAAVLAKLCSEYPGYEGKGNFKQTYLLCICMTKNQEQLMEEIASIDCKDALEMICNLESEGDEKGALCLCSAFLKRQLLQGDVYCAWELTLFWSKLLMRLESSADAFLGQSKDMALLCRSVCHILFLIKVIQNEVGEVGLPVCVEMCIQALKMTSSDHKDSKSTICKTISCLLPTDLEVKRACQLTEFLLQPTVDSYYAVESLYNEPDQKPEEDGSLPVPNSLRCELLLALKTQWPFDPEFWDWKTLKRNCLALMGEEAAIVSSIDTLNDTDEQEMHCGSKPYICIQLDCKANFNSNSELLMHRKTHPEFKAQCMFPNCGKVFSEAYLLYDHEAQHYLTYTCQTDNCGKIFYSQSQFLSHQQNHCANATVNNFPITNQNPPPVTPKAGPPPESTQSSDDTSSAAVCPERINSDVYMKEASKENMSPCRSPPAGNEPAPVRVKHSIESMLNPAADLAMKEPEKCYTPLTNPTAAPADTKVPPEAPHAHQLVAGQCEIPPEYPVPSTTNPVAGQQGDGHSNVQGNEFPKAMPQMIFPSQIKTEIPSSLQGYPSSKPAVAAGSEENLHCCPYNDCTRAYSTNKSLSRHVKKQHPEIFEDWKLAKKYNKVAKITAKKAPSGPVSPNQSQNLSNRPANQPGVLCNKLGVQQMDYPVGCSSSPAQCYPGSMEPVPITPMVNPTVYPPWGNPNNPGGMMQSDMSQSWSSPPMNNCYPDAFNMNDYPSRGYPQWQADPYQTTASLPSDRDHSMAAIHGPTMSQAPSDSSLMSQYVSSSLMLDNGGQMHNGGHQYGLVHPEGSGEGVDVRKNSASMTGELDNGNSISTIDSLPEGSYHPPYAQTENSCLTQGSSVDIPLKCLSPEAQVALKATNEIIKTENMSTPGYDQMDNSGDGMLSPHSVVHTDFPYDEDCHNAECEASPAEEKGSDPDVQKGKRSRLSKRTKWPAIIKDGKVICRRCFREFTSTKSLGGHLSKRSQCRPLDEIDLTADLPTSFLDFLNDPHVPDTNGAIYNQEKTVELSNPGLTVPYQEDHLMEISHAFQRLDLIEAAQEKMRSVLSLEQNVSHCDTAPDREKSKVPSKSDDKPLEKVPKPFKCDQDDYNEHNPEADKMASQGDAVKEGFTPEVSTVTRLPSPQNYLNDTSLSDVVPPPEGTPEQPQVAVVNQSPEEKLKCDLKEKLSPVGKAKEQRGKADVTLSKVKEPKSMSPTTSASSSPEKPGSSKNTPTKDESQRKDKLQKRLSLKMCDADNAYSPYRPYRCVHEGCTAAFTIQQNLILHYRAMHQASLPTTKTEPDPEKTAVKNGQESSPSIGKDNEVRCQVKNCSRVFMGITRLVQHYLLLHKFTRDKATAMMASMTIGTFDCDRPECALPFNSVEKYIEHIKNYHKEIAISESGSVDPTFRCEYEGCDRVYTTKSNLLRHLIKKHDYVYDPKTSDGRRTKSVGLFTGVNGKENVENKFKMKKKNTKKKEGKSIEHWTSFGKPTLKSHEEASAMCTKKSALQYPCMIIGCDAVERAERNIFKHYTTHGLTERYIEDQRSQFIFCKKYSRARFKDANKSEGASSSSSEETEPEEGEKPSDQKTEELVDRLGQEDSKLSNDDSAESQASTGTDGGIKRGRPRKPAHPTPACPERMQTLRNRTTVNSSRENSNPGTPTAQEQRDDMVMSGSFKPLGLEDSFLKLREANAKMSTSSVSKGCFVFKPSAKKKKTLSLEDHFTDGCEGAENSELRFKLCQDLWDNIKTYTEVLQDELNRKILDSLLDFTRKCSSTRQHSDWASQMRASEIPTAALVLGVNVPDHDMTFQSLSELLQQSVTPYVASVQAKECGVLKHLMKKVLERLMDTDVAVDDDEEEEQATEETSAQLHKSVHCSLSTLCDWYNMKTKKSSSGGTPGKKRSSPAKEQQQQQPPVVIIFKDLEAFNPRVLQDFILICSRYIERLPLTFIFGIATSPSTIQHMLPHSVSSLLCIELFQSLSCTQHLATVIDKLILTPRFPFKLNGKVMQVLMSIFLYHDFSVRNFIKGVQLALLEHFHSQPLSVLCCNKKEALFNVTQLSHCDLERIRQLMSFKRYVEKQEEQEKVNLLKDDDHLKEVCQRLIKDLRKYHKSYYPILKCLHTLTSSLPRYPLGKQIRELHLICLEKNVWEIEDYQSAIKLLKMLAKDELITLLQRCAEILQSAKSKRMKKAFIQLEELLAKFKQLDNLFQLQKTLLEMNESRRSKRLSPFEVVRNEALEFIDSLVKSHLSPPESQPLYEVCYYSSSAIVRRHLNATPRTSIQAALSSPYYYLQNENLKTEDGSVSNAAPDICIAYKLHLECGRLINLYDWLEAYATVVSGAEGNDPDSDNFGKVDEVKHARFIQAVSELEFLGFIKSTKQKTDHVARLTWEAADRHNFTLPALSLDDDSPNGEGSMLRYFLGDEDEDDGDTGCISVFW
ncbi:hypothetical protein INR49_019925, partial [Caranx melampygus]